MAQQRIKFIRQSSGGYIGRGLGVIVEADTPGGATLDANEDFRLVVKDTMPESEVIMHLENLLVQLKDGQLLREVVKL